MSEPVETLEEWRRNNDLFRLLSRFRLGWIVPFYYEEERVDGKLILTVTRFGRKSREEWILSDDDFCFYLKHSAAAPDSQTRYNLLRRCAGLRSQTPIDKEKPGSNTTVG